MATVCCMTRTVRVMGPVDMQHLIHTEPRRRDGPSGRQLLSTHHTRRPAWECTQTSSLQDHICTGPRPQPAALPGGRARRGPLGQAAAGRPHDHVNCGARDDRGGAHLVRNARTSAALALVQLCRNLWSQPAQGMPEPCS